jgi:hypothetical protein
VQGKTHAGSSGVTLRASNLAQGVYVLKLEAGSYRATRKLIRE